MRLLRLAHHEGIEHLAFGGRIVFSFLELPYNWEIFEMTWRNVANGTGNVHLNTFFSRDMVECWAGKLGLKIVEFHAATEPCIPGIPRCCGWLSGNAPRAIRVVTTGIPVSSASSSNSAVASPRITPPPT